MTKRLQRIGNSKGVVLTRTMMDHLGIDGDEVEVTMEEGRIVLSAPKGSSSTRRGQSFQEAKASTFAQYGDALQRLADS